MNEVEIIFNPEIDKPINRTLPLGTIFMTSAELGKDASVADHRFDNSFDADKHTDDPL